MIVRRITIDLDAGLVMRFLCARQVDIYQFRAHLREHLGTGPYGSLNIGIDVIEEIFAGQTDGQSLNTVMQSREEVAEVIIDRMRVRRVISGHYRK